MNVNTNIQHREQFNLSKKVVFLKVGSSVMELIFYASWKFLSDHISTGIKTFDTRYPKYLFYQISNSFIGMELIDLRRVLNTYAKSVDQ